MNAINYPLATETWDEKEYKALQRVIDSGRFTMGPEVKKFEQDFAKFFGSKFAVMVNSGSSANLLMIGAMIYDPRKFLKPGDVVLVPAVSWSTTYYPLHQYGVQMRFVDVNPDTLNIDPDLIEAAITPETKGIFVVNLLGNPCDFEKIVDICKRHNLVLIEDNCESMGATINGKQAGTFGICGSYSTFFSHHISTMEGGVIVTDDEMVYHTLISLRAHGWTREQPDHSHLKLKEDPFTNLFRFVLPGYNVRPLEMEGALGQEQLLKLPNIIQKRRDNAEIFKRELGHIPNIRLQGETGKSSWFGFSMILEGPLRGQRPALVKALQAAGVECRPIVTGNFLKNPVIELLNHSIGSDIIHAEEVDVNGLFVGNHHYPIESQIKQSRTVIESFCQEFSNAA
jgi:CDP-4-dehydro-6-deoxyglucose reductase, E1